jgi:hypothetical protein
MREDCADSTDVPVFDSSSYVAGLEEDLDDLEEAKDEANQVEFGLGMWQLGGYALCLSGTDLQIGRGETIADTARVLSRYVDCLMARVFAHKDVEELARHGVRRDEVIVYQDPDPAHDVLGLCITAGTQHRCTSMPFDR